MRSIETNGVILSVDDRGDGYPIVLIHGFPETSFSWRNQVPALSDAGFRPISYDLRGSGRSSGPNEIEAYSLSNQIADAIGILDRLGIERAAFVGHDWGSIITYAAALRHPDRVSHVASLNVPYLGSPAGFPPTDVIRRNFVNRLGYVLSFQEPGETEARFASDPDAWLKRVFRGVAGRDEFQSESEFSHYRDAFVASGLTGLLNLYRNIDRNFEEMSDLAGARIAQPCLMITADRDPVLPASLADGMVALVDDLEVSHLTECGHWSQQECPEAVNSILLDWLDRRIG
ncbi:MAG: alpha/beta hydrolase [Actinomycetota bacterium]|nr:alpha/beta hydrolase [Actinomycetota bacterium]